MLPRVDAPTTTTIHDLQHEAYPQFFSRPQLSYRRHVYGRSVMSSRIVITVSEHVRDDLVERLGYPAERVRVIHHGVDHERFTLEAAGKREPFLLYPANWWPHKNHELLLEAFASVRRERPELRPCSRARSPWRAFPTATSLGRGRRTARRAYRSAAALVFRALEGFGCRRWRRWRAGARSRSHGWLRLRGLGTPPSTSTRRRRPSQGSSTFDRPAAGA
jgi:hypothetical protein